MPEAPALWGLQMTPVVPVTEFMRDLLQPAADTLFTSVSVVVDKDGESEYGPRTDEDWARLRTAAVTIAESVFLLKIPRPIAPEPDRERHETELTAAQVLEKLQEDTVLWDARIQAVRNVALQAIDVVERRDTEELWDVGANLYQACQNCHYDYWYPAQRDLLIELEEKVRQFREQSGSATP
ncbi:MAG: hypothetical protein FJW23_07980 [Acidimicrobiia bacterium]|nr:hypothetical protein [Acidimicrobiia bacterium]